MVSVEATVTRLPLALQRRDQRGEVAIARKQHQMVVERRHLERIDGELDVHVALDLPAPGGVGELLGGLGDHGEAVVVEPVDQRPDRGVFLILDQRRVVVGAQQVGLGLELGEQPAIIDVDPDGLAGRVEIGAVDEKDNSSRADRLT